MALLAIIDLTKKYYEREKQKKKEHKITQTNKFRKKMSQTICNFISFYVMISDLLRQTKGIASGSKAKTTDSRNSLRPVYSKGLCL